LSGEAGVSYWDNGMALPDPLFAWLMGLDIDGGPSWLPVPIIYYCLLEEERQREEGHVEDERDNDLVEPR